MKLKLFLFTCLLISLLNCFAQSPFKAENTICYCQSSGYSISNILQTDSNYLIANSLWNSPKTIAEIRASGIQFTQSQFLLLQVFKLIRREANTYYSNVPFLDSLNTIKLREDAKTRANIIYPFIEDKIQLLLSDLQKHGYAKNTFSILFSYILDGRIWNELEKRKVISPRNLSLQNPLWAGEFWSLSSQRNLKCGTNSYSGKTGLELNINWANPAISKLSYFFRQNGSSKFFGNLNSSLCITDEKLRKELEPMQIIDSDGKLRIPVIQESQENFIYQHSLKIIDEIADQMLKTSFSQLMQDLKFTSLSQTIIISYHETMWYLMETLVEKKLINIPKLFTETMNNKENDISEVMFLVQKGDQLD